MKDMLDVLRRKYRFDEWRGRSRAAESVFAWRFFLSGNEFAGWRAHRIHTAQTPEGPIGTLSVWQRVGGEKDDLLGVDVYEAESRAAAHDYLLRLLGEFQGDLGEPRGAIGDVSFVSAATALFARANLVVLVRALGTGDPPVNQIADAFDRSLVTRPNADGPFAPKIDAFRSRASTLGAALEIAATDPQGRPVQYRLFAPSGELSASAGTLRFVPKDDGPVRVTAYAINADRHASSAEVSLPQ